MKRLGVVVEKLDPEVAKAITKQDSKAIPKALQSDPDLDKFKRRTLREPTQVLRYQQVRRCAYAIGGRMMPMMDSVVVSFLVYIYWCVAEAVNIIIGRGKEI